MFLSTKKQIRCLRPLKIYKIDKISIRISANLCYLSKSSRQWCSVKEAAVTNFTIVTGKNLCHSLFFNKVLHLKPETFLQKTFDTTVFMVTTNYTFILSKIFWLLPSSVPSIIIPTNIHYLPIHTNLK